MPRISNRTARLEARVSPEVLAIVKSAANLQGVLDPHPVAGLNLHEPGGA